MNDLAASIPKELRFRRKVTLTSALVEQWRARSLVRTLAERDLRARYKQAFLGAAWAVLTPFVMMVVFTLFFQRVAKIDTAGVPYPLFSYLGLLPWTFFSASVMQGGQSLLTNAMLLNKVYCPREVFPVAGVAVAAIDTTVACLPLAILFVVLRFMPQPTMVWAPLLFLIQVAFTLGVTLVVSASVLYLRDIRHLLPIVLQVGLFVTPVAYGMEVIPVAWRLAYSIINPLAPIIDGYRRTVLYGLPPDWHLLLPAAVTSVVWLLGGYLLFKRLETGFADVA